MAMKVRYTVLDGEIVEENRGGVITDYVADPLGSTVALLDGTQTKSDTFNYWPYGEVQSRSGSTATPFQFVGTWGYYRDSSSRTYVRARYYRQSLGRWQTGARWAFQSLGESKWGYASGNPQSSLDPLGEFPIACAGCALCIGAAGLYLLLSCRDSRNFWGCVLCKIIKNPWLLAALTGCALVCAICIGPYVSRFLELISKGLRGFGRNLNPAPALGGMVGGFRIKTEEIGDCDITKAETCSDLCKNWCSPIDSPSLFFLCFDLCWAACIGDDCESEWFPWLDTPPPLASAPSNLGIAELA